jgi:hypothetical protein
MRIAMLLDVSASMQGVGKALAQAFCYAATPQTKQNGEMTLITFGVGADVECVDAPYLDFMDYIAMWPLQYAPSTNLDAALVEVNKLGKFDYIYILCDGYPNGIHKSRVTTNRTSWPAEMAKEIKQTLLNTNQLIGVYINQQITSPPDNPLEAYLEKLVPDIQTEPNVTICTFGFQQGHPTHWNVPGSTGSPYGTAGGFMAEDQS